MKFKIVAMLKTGRNMLLSSSFKTKKEAETYANLLSIDYLESEPVKQFIVVEEMI